MKSSNGMRFNDSIALLFSSWFYGLLITSFLVSLLIVLVFTGPEDFFNVESSKYWFDRLIIYLFALGTGLLISIPLMVLLFIQHWIVFFNFSRQYNIWVWSIPIQVVAAIWFVCSIYDMYEPLKVAFYGLPSFVAALISALIISVRRRRILNKLQDTQDGLTSVI